VEVYELSLDGTVKKISALPDGVRLVCAFGCFDGVHLGHRALLSAAVEKAEKLNRLCEISASAKRGAEECCGEGASSICDVRSERRDCGAVYASAVWTFSEPVSRPWIISVAERLSLCGSLGIRYAICQRFENVRTLSPEEFIDSMVAQGLCHGVCGYNFRFGYKGAGEPERLRKCLNASLARNGCLDGALGEDTVTVVGRVCALGDAVSSTRIRAVLADGGMEETAALLGRPYSLSGTILSGKQIGRTISRPTANLIYSPDQLVPKRGVYFTYCRVKGNVYRAVTNVGYRPTVNSDVDSVTCEAHLLDFSDSVYGECAEIIFVHYHREERAFSSVEELSVQINHDVEAAIGYFDARERENV